MQAATDTTTVLLAGDVMTGRGIDQAMAHHAPPALHEAVVHDARDYLKLAERAHGPIPAPVPGRYLWGDALADIDRMAPDAFVANLETAITVGGEPWPDKGVHYRMHPANAGCLKPAHLSACALANNHTLDWGPDGLADTLRALARAGVPGVGAGADIAQATTPLVLPLGAQRRLLVAAWAAPDCGVPEGWAAAPGKPGIALLENLSNRGLQQIADALQGQRREGDLVMLSIHWGPNQVEAVSPLHRRFAHELIDRDIVDLVHGHSAHHPLPFDIHRGKLVLYGCGDLINDYEGIPSRGGIAPDLACLFAATLSQGSGRLIRLQIMPLQRRGFRLVRASPGARAAIRHALQLKGNGHGRQLLWRSDGHWVIDSGAASAPGKGLA